MRSDSFFKNTFWRKKTVFFIKQPPRVLIQGDCFRVSPVVIA